MSTIQYFVLFGDRESAVQRENDPAFGLLGVVARHRRHRLDLRHTAQEHEQVAALRRRVLHAHTQYARARLR